MLLFSSYDWFIRLFILFIELPKSAITSTCRLRYEQAKQDHGLQLDSWILRKCRRSRVMASSPWRPVDNDSLLLLLCTCITWLIWLILYSLIITAITCATYEMRFWENPILVACNRDRSSRPDETIIHTAVLDILENKNANSWLPRYFYIWFVL